MTNSNSVNRELHEITCNNLTVDQSKKLKADIGTILTVSFFTIAIAVAITCYVLGLIPAEFK